MNEQTKARHSRPSLFTLAIVVACLGLGAIDVGLVFRNRALARRVATLTRAVNAAEHPALVEGDRFPTLAAWDASGATVELARSPDHTLTLLFVSSDGCGSCAGVRPMWEELARRCVGSHVRALELVVDATEETLVGRDAVYAVVRGGDDVWALTSRMPGIPAAIVIDETGLVVRAFYGEEHDGLREAVESLLLLR